ncbi:25S rRNA (adenine645-N1)-methyltransferase [Xanthoria parietina]
MFAVPGWSVSASQLKLQRESTSKEKTAKADDNGQSTLEEKKSKKRKRGHGKINGAEVTNDNVADLWQTHIEGRNLPRKSEDENPPRKKKRVRKQKTSDLVDAGKENHSREAQDEEISSKQLPPTANDPEKRTSAPANTTAVPPNRKTKNKQRENKGHEQPQLKDPEASPPLRASTTESAPKPAATTPAASLPPPPPLPSKAKLTPLQTAMRAKLISARFRHLNQTLYTTPSTHASTLFSSNPEAFASYHAGFRSQVASWPSNPVEIFIEEIKTRGASGGSRSQKQLWRTEKKKKGKTNADPKSGVSEAPQEDAAAFTKIDPLPRHFQTKTCTIIDLGCGEAHLHASLLPLAGSLKLKLQSFDLAPGAGPNAHLITVSDIAKLPLADGSADVAIFCLALMGTNWINFVVEAARVVRVGGECWVGEVRSRFAGAKDIEKLKGEKGRKGNKVGKKEKRKKNNGDEEDDDEELKKVGAPIQVEEEDISAASGKQVKPKEQETDVGPFLEVFRRRGFVLKGEVDLGNKMFVRMKFARVRDHGAGGPRRQDGPKFVERDDGGDLDPEVEAQVLKPCVYKTR